MLKPYCPNGCQINTVLFLKNNPALTEMGVNTVICPLCECQMKVTTRDVLDFTCEKVEKPSFWKKIKKWPVLSALHDWFGRPSRLV